MKQLRLKRPQGRLSHAILIVAGLAALGAGPASAQWYGGPYGYGAAYAGPLPPGAIVRSLMRQGFIEVGPPRFNGRAYVVHGVSANGTRLRLVIDAYDGGLISRTRLDQPLLPPAEVGRQRTARILGQPPEEMPLPPGRVDLGDLPPPLGAAQRPLPPSGVGLRAEPLDPALAPHRAPASPREKQAKRPEPAARPAGSAPAKRKENTAQPPASPSAPAPVVGTAKSDAKPEQPAATAAAPEPAVKALEVQSVSPPAPASKVETPTAQSPADQPKEGQDAPARTVRVIEGVAPLKPEASVPQKAAEEKRSETPPPAALE